MTSDEGRLGRLGADYDWRLDALRCYDLWIRYRRIVGGFEEPATEEEKRWLEVCQRIVD